MNWNNGGGWNDATSGVFPDWLQVDFNGSKTIDEVDVFTLPDNPATPAEPTETMTFSLYGLTSYDVQYWNGSAWVTVPGGTVTGNNKVWRKFTFAAITTSKIRVMTNGAVDGYSRMTEIEAWGNSEASGTSSNINWLVTDQLGTPRMNFFQTGNLANVKRHDYLPFGEELYAGVGGRTTGQGYAGDAVRQKFTSKERDNETGLDYSNAQGRFTSPDEFSGGPTELFVLGSSSTTKQALPYAEITNPQSINKYQYTYNNPLRFIDSNGHQTDTKKSLIDRALEYFSLMWKAQNPQDGMLPNSGDGEFRKPEQNGPMDMNASKLANAATKNAGRRLEIIADVEMAYSIHLVLLQRPMQLGKGMKGIYPLQYSVQQLRFGV